ncbi:hypothetical protein B0H16DRAFT_674838 [Mycena metata]|uniref:Uncharacterized protein n=1 Tax=Mycena metata TaxID=1033252 RepID=A0AAD7J5U9_9AGAR|nr:hypothetical protein B0H16DRAFT_674838 [Mycena metata]
MSSIPGAYLLRVVQLFLGLGLGGVEIVSGCGLELRMVVFHVFLRLPAGLARSTTCVLFADRLDEGVLVLRLGPTRLRCKMLRWARRKGKARVHICGVAPGCWKFDMLRINECVCEGGCV